MPVCGMLPSRGPNCAEIIFNDFSLLQIAGNHDVTKATIASTFMDLCKANIDHSRWDSLPTGTPHGR